MLDELLMELFGHAVFGRLTNSRRAQLLFRIFFGLLGAGLGAAGAVHFGRGIATASNPAMTASMVAMFGCMAALFLFNLGLGRRWRWPAVGFAASFVALFATRILFGP